MERLNCLTIFMESGKKFKLPSGETYDQLRQSENSTKPTSDDVPEADSMIRSQTIPNLD